MGFYPFHWTWRTRSGGQVRLFGVLVTLPLLGGSWWWSQSASFHERSTNDVPNDRFQREKDGGSNSRELPPPQ
jgi:hypothetical protein